MRPILDGQIAESVIVTGNTPFTRPENRVMYPGLDGLRAVAFLMVFGQHYYQMPWGWTGVDLFFVLSGFLITGILWDTRCDRHRIRNFYVRRTLRIFPLYYGVMLAMLALHPLANWDWNWRFLVWPTYLGNYARFVHPYALREAWQRVGDFEMTWSSMRTQFDFHLGHFWSLCVEEQFYLIWPWVVFHMLDRRKLAWLCASTMPICLCLRLGGEHWLPQWMLDSEILYRATPFRIDALLTGGLIALLIRGPFSERILRHARKVFPGVLAVVLLWLLINPASHLWQRPYNYPTWKFTWGLAVCDLVSGLLILAAIQSASLTCKLLSLRPLRWMGRISYGAYILHDIPHTVYVYVAKQFVWHVESGRRLSQNSLQHLATLVAGVIGMAATLILAWLSYRFFESPFLNLKERWTITVMDDR